MNKQAGFTLVELVVVIIILGILAATALPRFMNVQEQAHQAAVDGASGGLGAGVAMFRAQWVANGHTTAEVTVDGFGDGSVDAGNNGWPVGTDGGNAVGSAADCVAIWNGVMQNPPTVSTAATSDYQAVFAAAPVCTYNYMVDGTASRSIVFNANTGGILVTNP